MSEYSWMSKYSWMYDDPPPKSPESEIEPAPVNSEMATDPRNEDGDIPMKDMEDGNVIMRDPEDQDGKVVMRDKRDRNVILRDKGERIVYEDDYDDVGEDDDDYYEEEEDEGYSTLQVALHYCMTQGGLIVILIVYAVIGAVVIQALEAPAEANAVEDLRLERFAYRGLLIEKLKNISHWAQHDENQWWRRASRHLKGYEDELGIEVLNPPKFESRWNFYGSMFFATTVLTTIGYGNIAPKTKGGRVFCIFYAIIGIALLLIILANIGNLLAQGATLTYRRMHTMVETIKGAEEEDENLYKRDRRSQEIIDEIWSSPSELDNGRGEVIPMHVVSLRDKRKDGGGGGDDTKRWSAMARAGDEQPKKEPRIPITGILIFAFLYVFVLALLLRMWEDQWNYFEAFYFSFITLTTIGFGDLTPRHQKNLLAAIFFILLGMAVVSMCIALAQEVIIEKVQWFSDKVSVIAFCQRRKQKREEEEEET